MMSIRQKTFQDLKMKIKELEKYLLDNFGIRAKVETYELGLCTIKLQTVHSLCSLLPSLMRMYTMTCEINKADGIYSINIIDIT